MKEILPKTYTISLKNNHNLSACLSALSLTSKNLYNNSLFIIKNLTSCYHYQDGFYHLKTQLYENQQNALNLVNHYIDQFNEIQTVKRNKKLNHQKVVIEVL